MGRSRHRGVFLELEDHDEVTVRLRRLALVWLVTAAAGADLAAQQPKQVGPPELGIYEVGRGLGHWSVWHAGIGTPEAIEGGLTVVVGAESIHTHWANPRYVRGLLLGGNAGVGGGTMRLGWADVGRADAGPGGWSVEAIYVRPWLLQWGMRRNANYVGATGTLYLGQIRFSGGLVRDVSGHRGFAPKFEAGLIWDGP